MSSSHLSSRRWLAASLAFALVIMGLSAGSSLAVVPTLTPEEPLSDPVSGPAAERQMDPAVAWNGTNHFAVWQDSRGNTSSVWGSLLDATGAPDDPGNVLVVSGAQGADVASDAEDFLVVWGQGDRIVGMIVQADGTMGSPFDIYQDVGFQQSDPSVAFDGTNYLVAWEDYAAGNGDVEAARVDPSGTVLDSTPITLSDGAESQSTTDVTSTGNGGWLVAWTDYSADVDGDVFGTLVAANGTVATTDGGPLADTADTENGPHLASNGTDYLMSWWGAGVVQAARIDSTGTVLDSPALVISGTATVLNAGGVVSDGSDYLVTWFTYASGVPEDSYTHGAIVAGDDGAIDVADVEIGPFLEGNISDTAAADFDGTDYVVLYGDEDIYAEKVSTAGVAAETDTVVTVSAARQASGDIVGTPDGFFAAWQETLSAQPAAILFGRLGPDGTPLDGAGSPVPVVDANQAQLEPVIAWNGSTALIVWQDWGSGIGSAPDVRAARVDATGTLLDVAPIDIAVGPNQIQHLDVASVGNDFLVVWAEVGGDNDVRGRIVTGDGDVPSPSFPIASGPDHQWRPRVAGGGDRYLVTWEDKAIAPDEGIVAATVSTAGVVGPPQVLTAGAYFPFNPVVAWSGNGFLVAWTEEGFSTSDYDLMMRRFGANGTAIGSTTPITDTDADDEFTGEIVFDGTHYVLYHQHRPGGPNSVDVARRIAVDGSLVDSSAFSVSGIEDVGIYDVASRGDDDALFLYGRFAVEPPFASVDRLFTRSMSNGVNAVPVMKAPKAAFQKSKSFGVAWTSPAAQADVYVRKASTSTGFGAPKAFKTGTAGTSATYAGTPGGTYCFSARSRNVDDYVSAFSSQRCTAVPVDDKSLVAKGAWSRIKAKGYYLNTYSQTSSKGASLARKVRGKRFALVATKCPGCGTVKVFFGKKLLKKVSLANPTVRKKQLIALGGVPAPKTAKLRIVVVTGGKAVIIEGVGVSAI